MSDTTVTGQGRALLARRAKKPNPVAKMLAGQVRSLKWDLERRLEEIHAVRRELEAERAVANERKRLLDMFVSKAVR